jgi:hypothetical protein
MGRTHSTPRTDAWRESLRVELDELGMRADLARHLCEGDESQFEAKQVQVARVLNQGMVPSAEFVLSALEWLDAKRRRAKRRQK